jgi:hypothetical protein
LGLIRLIPTFFRFALQKVVHLPPGESPLEQAPDGSKGDLLIPAPPANDTGDDENDNKTNDDDNNEEEDQEQCAICLVEYEAGDEISWSHNKSCTHAFHRDCIIDWLVSHDECPCCRHNYLSLGDDDNNNNVEGGGTAAVEEGRNRAPPPVPVPVVRSEGDQLVRGMHLLYELSRFPGFPSRHGGNSGDTPVEDAPGSVVQNGQASAANVETGMMAPETAEVDGSETVVHNETQTAISGAPEQAVDASSSELNEGSRLSVVHTPDMPPVSSTGPSGIAEQSVTEPVELETSAGQGEAPMHNSQPMVRPELLEQAEGETNNPNSNEGETSTADLS